MAFDEFDDYQEEERGPSRSARKREAEELKKLGEELVALPAGKLKQIALPEELAEAVLLAQRIKSGSGRRRQLQFIGKLMRREDPAPIRDALERIQNRSSAAVAEMHLAERWRERLLTEGDSALAEFLSEHDDTDPQRLRQLIRGAQREHAAGKPPKSARELYRALRDALSS